MTLTCSLSVEHVNNRNTVNTFFWNVNASDIEALYPYLSVHITCDSTDKPAATPVITALDYTTLTIVLNPREIQIPRNNF